MWVDYSSPINYSTLTMLQLLKDRAVWGALAIGFFLMFCESLFLNRLRTEPN
jgi:hypothetical protein